MTFVGKGQRDATPARQNAVYFHDRHQACQAAVFNYREIQRLIPVRLAQNPGPSGGLEEGGLWVREEEIVPVGVGAGVDDLDVRHCI